MPPTNGGFTSDSVQIARLEERVEGIKRALVEHREHVDARFESVSTNFDTLSGKLDTLINRDAQVKGGWKAVTLVGGIVGTVVEAGHWVAAHLK